jgi:hypothetical protein
VASLEQAFRHGQAHAAGSDPTDLLSILRHPETLPFEIVAASKPAWRPFSRSIAIAPVAASPKRDSPRACDRRSKRYPVIKGGKAKKAHWEASTVAGRCHCHRC